MTRHLNVSTTVLIALRTKYRDLTVIRDLINTRRLYSYPISIEWTSLESAYYFTKSTIACSVYRRQAVKMATETGYTNFNTIDFLHAPYLFY
jgi:hypothetical protein